MYFEATEFSWHNGKIVQREQAAPSIASHSLHLGIGVFDGMMAYWNENNFYIHQMDAHLNRFQNGSKNMGLEFPWSNEELKSGIKMLLDKVPKKNYYIRPIVYHPNPQINVLESDAMPVDVAIFGVTVPRDVETPISCHISPFERVSSRAIPVCWKICGTYVNSYLVRRTAKIAGFNDGIMLDREGRIAEASAANIFFLDRDAIVTPRLTSDIFPGITRLTLIDIAKSLGIEVFERDILPKELPNFEGAFLAATLMELKPINNIENLEYQSASNPLFQCILKEFRALTHQ
ncbi:aminotransferase class IV [Nostoc sp.]|uniref:aminotransferase class IV n=1 Tax=Nostoc sp. TaxID=1180 RepID=UPI002FF83E1B